MRHISVFKGIKERLNELLGVHPKDTPEALTEYSIQASMLENCRRIGKGLCFNNPEGIVLSGFTGTVSGASVTITPGTAITKSGKVISMEESIEVSPVEDEESVYLKYTEHEVEVGKGGRESPIQNSASKQIVYDEYSHAVNDIHIQTFTHKGNSNPTDINDDWVRLGTMNGDNFILNSPYIKNLKVKHLTFDGGGSIIFPEEFGVSGEVNLKDSNGDDITLEFENGILKEINP